jgi:ABC-2 type transport system permease protein
VAILFGIGIWFGLQMSGDYATLGLIVLLGSVIFLALGFAIAGWAKNEDQAAPVANLISLPMMFLSGVFFPRDAMPDILAGITQYMPLTYVNEALRGVVNNGASLAALGPQLLGMGVWAVITFVIAIRLFRWE